MVGKAVGMQTKKPMVRKKRNGEQTEARILDLAIPIFANEGYDAVNMRAIAAACQINPATIYIYYPNKRSLYVAACLTCFERMTRKILAMVDRTAPPREQARSFIKALVAVQQEEPASMKFFARELVSPDPELLVMMEGVGFAQAFDYMNEIMGQLRSDDSVPLRTAGVFALSIGIAQLVTMVGAAGRDVTFAVSPEKLADFILSTLILSD